MSFDVSTNYGNVTGAYAATNTAPATAAAKEKAAVSPKQDGFVKTPYKPDAGKVKAMKAGMAGNMAAFRSMVQSLATKQGTLAGQAAGFALKNVFENLQVDPQTKEAAQNAIAEGGEWGVEAVAQRIFEFAQALSGGDPDKAEALRDAVKKGFDAAKEAWGGALPEISGKTYDRVMQLFDEWVKPKEDTPAQ